MKYTSISYVYVCRQLSNIILKTLEYKILGFLYCYEIKTNTVSLIPIKTI